MKSFIASKFKSACRRQNRAKCAADIGRNGDVHVWIAGFEWRQGAYPKGAWRRTWVITRVCADLARFVSLTGASWQFDCILRLFCKKFCTVNFGSASWISLCKDISNGEIFQSSEWEQWMSQSSCNQHAYSVWNYFIPMILSANEFGMDHPSISVPILSGCTRTSL